MHVHTYPERLKLLGLERLKKQESEPTTICVQTLVRPYSPTSKYIV